MKAENINISELSFTDKLQLMEDLWGDIAVSHDRYQSPDWHGEILSARVERRKSGEEAFVSWDSVKKAICKL